MERDIQRKVVLYARSLGVLCVKMAMGGGWPDYLFLYGGKAWFIEFKSPGEKPSKLQTYVIGLIRSVGFNVYVISNVVSGKETIRSFVDGTYRS